MFNFLLKNGWKKNKVILCMSASTILNLTDSSLASTENDGKKCIWD